MFIRKTRAGSTATHHWPHDGAVVEVPDHLAVQYLAIPDGGFMAVHPDQAGDPASLAMALQHGIDPKIVDMVRAEIANQMAESRDEFVGFLRHELGKLRESLTGPGTAAPGPVSPPDGPAAAVDPAGAGPSGGTTPPAAGSKPAVRK